MPESYFLEAQAYFEAGKLDDPSNELVTTTTPGVRAGDQRRHRSLPGGPGGRPDNARAWAELARIQTYSSSMLRNDTERLARLEEAIASADTAIELAPDDSTIRAIRAFVLDWYAFSPLIPQEQSLALLVEAEREASRAFQLDPENALALAYYAEILADEQKWTQAEKYAAQAVALDTNLMDTHRVYGYVLETLGKYNSAIQQYQEAARINPNLTFLYIRIGQQLPRGHPQPRSGAGLFRPGSENQPAAWASRTRPLISKSPEPIRRSASSSPLRSTPKRRWPWTRQRPDLWPTWHHLPAGAQLRGRYVAAEVRSASVALSRRTRWARGDVEGLPLTSVTVAYYYVEYGTNLAFLSRPNENYCAEALEVLQEVRSILSRRPNLDEHRGRQRGHLPPLAGWIWSPSQRITPDSYAEARPR